MTSLTPEDKLVVVCDWDIVALFGLAQLNSDCRTLVARYLRQAQIDFFAGFTQNPAWFREKMRAYSAVLSGITLLQFLSRDLSPGQVDIELYCPDYTFDTLTTFLIENLSGMLKHEISNAPPPFGPIKYAEPPYDRLSIGTYRHRVIRTPFATFDVFRSNTTTTLTPLAYFNITLTMNFMSSDCICITYPWTFLDNVGVISPRHDLSSVRSKYRKFPFKLCKTTIEAWVASTSPCASPTVIVLVNGGGLETRTV